MNTITLKTKTYMNPTHHAMLSSHHDHDYAQKKHPTAHAVLNNQSQERAEKKNSLQEESLKKKLEEYADGKGSIAEQVLVKTFREVYNNESGSAIHQETLKKTGQCIC